MLTTTPVACARFVCGLPVLAPESTSGSKKIVGVADVSRKPLPYHPLDFAETAAMRNSTIYGDIKSLSPTRRKRSKSGPVRPLARRHRRRYSDGLILPPRRRPSATLLEGLKSVVYTCPDYTELELLSPLGLSRTWGNSRTSHRLGAVRAARRAAYARRAAPGGR